MIIWLCKILLLKNMVPKDYLYSFTLTSLDFFNIK